MPNLDQFKPQLGETAGWVQKTYAFIDYVGGIVDSLVNYRDKTELTEADFRLDADENDRATPVVVAGIPMHQLSDGDTLHAGDGWLPAKAATQHEVQVEVVMSAAEDAKNVRLQVSFYDVTNTLLRTIDLDNVPVASDTTTVTTIDTTGLILDTDYLSGTTGRLKITYLAASNNPHSGDLRIQRVRLIDV